jgi:guanine nucleotide-binding protein G(I)/G(S)/G(T) subunit beta-1
MRGVRDGGGGGGGGGPPGGGGGGGLAAPPSHASAHLASLLHQVGALRAQVESFQLAKQDDIDWRATGYQASEVPSDYRLAIRSRLLGGHAGRATALAWAADNTTLVSVGTDGVVMLWNAMKGEIAAAAKVPDEDVLTCVHVERDRVGDDALVLVGGLNQVCHVYRLSALRATQGWQLKPEKALPAAGGCLSCVRVLEHERVLAGGADGVLRCYDLTLRRLANKLDGHGGPVACAAVMPQDSDVCASGSADGRVRVWDMRLANERACVLSFGGFHGGGVTAIDFFPGGTAVAAGGMDSSVRLFDLRACGPVGVYCDARKRVGVNSLAFSATGALLFAAYEDPVCLAWEPMSANSVVFDMKSDYSKPVRCLASNGLAVALSGELDEKPVADICVWA